MKLSDINDRLIEGLGIITRDDAKVLDAARQLIKLLRKINFPSSLNKEFHNFLLEQQRQYRIKLQSLIDELEVGSKPIYYADLVNKKYSSQLKALEASINHDTMQAVFVERIDKLLVRDKHGYPSYIGTLRDYKIRSKQLTGSRKNNMELLYNEIGFHRLTDDEIIDEAFRLTKELFSLPVNEYEVDYSDFFEDSNIESPIIVREDGWYRLSEAMYVPFETKYYIMTSHKDISNADFRWNVEFISDVPSITIGQSEQMVKQLELDIKLIVDFMSEKEKSKKSIIRDKSKIDPASYGEKLINWYRGRWMKDFKIPQL